MAIVQTIRFCIMNNGTERLHGGFAPCTKGLWSCFKPVRIVIKRYLNVCMTVLHDEQKGFEVASSRFASWSKGTWTFAWRFCTMNKRALKLLQAGLHREQKVLERLHDGFARVQKCLEVSSRGFASCTKMPWSWFKGLCTCTKMPWSWFKGLCAVYKRVLKLVQEALRRVQKVLEQCKNGLVHGTIWAWSYFKPFLHREQFGPEVTSKKKSPITLITDLG